MNARLLAVPQMGSRIPFAEGLDFRGNSDVGFGWSVQGYYQTTTSSAGRHTLNIHGTLVAPDNLSADLNHYLAWVIGPQKTQAKRTEWVWLGWEQSKFSFLTVVSRDRQVKKQNSHFKLAHHRSENRVSKEHKSFSNYLQFQKSTRKNNPWTLRL